MQSLKSEFTRALKGSGMIIAPIIIFLLLLQEGLSTGLIEAFKNESGNTNVELFGMTVFFASVVLLIPFLSAIPYSAIFCEEYESGNIYLTLHRKSLFRYVSDKVITVWFTGFFVTFIPILLYGIICSVFAVPFDTSVEEYNQMLENTAWEVVLTNGGLIYIFLQSFFLGCFGASCALFALLVSVFFPNKYFTWCFPLIFCFVLNFILPRLNLSVFNPMQSFDPSYSLLNFSGKITGIIYMLLYHIVVFIIGFITFYAGIVRRVFYGTIKLCCFAVQKMEK